MSENGYVESWAETAQKLKVAWEKLQDWVKCKTDTDYLHFKVESARAFKAWKEAEANVAEENRNRVMEEVNFVFDVARTQVDYANLDLNEAIRLAEANKPEEPPSVLDDAVKSTMSMKGFALLQWGFHQRMPNSIQLPEAVVDQILEWRDNAKKSRAVEDVSGKLQ